MKGIQQHLVDFRCPQGFGLSVYTESKMYEVSAQIWAVVVAIAEGSKTCGDIGA